MENLSLFCGKSIRSGLGNVCNSPSSCFITTKDGHLSLYQAIVDARMLLSELFTGNSQREYSSSLSTLSDGEEIDSNVDNHKKHPLKLNELFNVCSTQSTGKPGCIIHLSRMIDSELGAGEILLMHTFDEGLALSDYEQPNLSPTDTQISSSGKFFTLLVQRSPDGNSTVIKMWSVKICTQTPTAINDQEIRSVTVSAGHLPSSSVYPACRTPYLLLLSCSDNTIRFLRCVRDPNKSYNWEMWRMIGDSADPSLDISGKVCSVSSAHSGRFACAFLSEATVNKDVASFVRNLNVSLYECESSGGVEWLQEERLKLDKCFPNREFINSILYNSADKATLSKLSNLVRLDWASTEDGTHILTVGVANLVFFFAQMSQNVAQQNVAMMAEEQQNRRPTLRRDSSIAASFANPLRSLTRWRCIRYVDLESVDGLPPIPSVLSWWNFKPIKEAPRAEVPHKSAVQKTVRIMGIRPVASASNLSASRSQLMLDQVLKLSTSKSPLEHKLDLKSETKSELGHDTSMTPEDGILKAVVEEGIFEAARLANPILPQYHPQVLIKMLNSGKTKRVKAILLHVLRALKQQQGNIKNPLSRAASVRRFNTSFAADDINPQESNASMGLSKQRSVIEDDELEYQELDGIPPIPLHALVSVDNVISGNEKAANIDGPKNELYDSLFKEGGSDEDLDDVLDDLQRGDNYSRSSRSRHSSIGSEIQAIPSAFTSRHNQMLSDLLGYIHLPGLSSVDQMHLLAIAATLSHFSSDVMDKLTQANASFQPSQQTTLVDTGASGYAASSGLGIETVDECGLRFLMAMKQHEYLLKHMPKQRNRLRTRGMSTSQIVWAFHSDAESELLNALPCCQKGQENWEDLRAYGIAWWVKNTTTLRLCIEKVAKTTYQETQNPMDVALYYLALRKKNVLTHLFKSVNDQPKADFFREDFEQEKWKKAAQKNAFILMSKQNFHYSAAFFLLAGSLKDAVQTILTRLKDLQLAMVVIRLYEADREKQISIMEEMLCDQVLGTTPTELREISKQAQNNASITFTKASRDPFVRSMTLWLSQEYAMSAFTLVEEASLASTEKFLSYARDLENRVTPYERRLYFRTAAAHMASGCPLLALDVISMLPRRMCSTVPTDLKVEDDVFAEKSTAEQKAPENVDWSAPTNVVKDDELKLDWSDGSQSEEEKEPKSSFNESLSAPKYDSVMPTLQDVEDPATETTVSIDFIAQHMKFVAALKMMTDGLSTLAGGVEVDGGQLRIELLDWLEKECTTLKEICEYRSDDITMIDHPDSSEEKTDLFSSLKRRRCWLLANQKLIRTFTSYCILHSAQNHRLTSVLMELILLLLEIQQETNGVQDDATLQTKTFPLFIASISTCRMFVSSPLNFIEDQCTDLLLTIAQFNQAPPFGTPISLIKKVYNLCQGLSSCLYQSLSCLDDVGRNDRDVRGVLTSRLRAHSFSHDDMAVKSGPASWPGVDSLVALLSLGRDEEAPNLRLVLLKSYFSVAVALFSYALAVYDSRWLYRLCARDVNSIAFGQIFGGAGEKNIHKVKPPNRPPPPSAKPVQPSVAAANTVRSNLHAKVFGADELKPQQIEQTVSCWIPPKKHIVQFFAEKVEPNRHAANEVIFDSDAESDASSDDEEYDDIDTQTKPHKDPNSYAWLLIRFACVVHQLDNLKRFLSVSGFEQSDGCPVAFLRNMYFGNESSVSTTTGHLSTPPLLRKYRSLIEQNNTPFEYTGHGVQAVKRLWAFLVRQENTSHYFIRHIFAKDPMAEAKEPVGTITTKSTSSQSTEQNYEPIKIVQREREGIISFACSNVRPGWMVVSTSREIQEINIERLIEDKENVHGLRSSSNFLNNRVDLDIALEQVSKDKLRDNDDYQIISNRSKTQGTTTFIWDTSVVPQLLHTLPNEHSARGGFSLRPVGSSSSLQGVQQIYYDSEMRLFSCGADYSLKIRNLPTY
ncbi:hypothetical protein M3Y97_00854600 [Aphelenchoides bicaudatus]|nr:hypothetical protein M3Y97_00854600 [Aphelenchoides bicaudatus]